jgi:hypothetical protein
MNSPADNTTIRAGTMMIQEGLLVPKGLNLVTDGYSQHWRSVTGLDSIGLERKIRGAGWHLFTLAGPGPTAIVLGRGGRTRMQHGVERIATKVRNLNFNCFGITAILPKRFLGIPYRLVQADSYHIQQSCVLDTVEQRRRAQSGSEWARG